VIVDAVVTWVDGSDQDHIKKRQKYLNIFSKKTSLDESAVPTRFNSSGEIDYCLRSLLHFAPWIRTIYVVTDGQIPSILSVWQGTPDADRFKIVDHRDIFKGFEAYLPTFNSLTIESMLWRIPGLSEQFIYLNDDCALLRPVRQEDFFKEGFPVVRGEWKTQRAYTWGCFLKRGLARILPNIFPLKTLAPHRKFQENSARLAGYTRKFLHLHHVPFPLVKQAFADVLKDKPELFLNNLNYPLRSPKQFWSISLVYHLGLKNKCLKIDNRLQAVTVHATHHTKSKIRAKLARARRYSNITFVCIQSLDQGTPEVRQALLAWLDERIPRIACNGG